MEEKPSQHPCSCNSVLGKIFLAINTVFAQDGNPAHRQVEEVGVRATKVQKTTEGLKEGFSKSQYGVTSKVMTDT